MRQARFPHGEGPTRAEKWRDVRSMNEARIAQPWPPDADVQSVRSLHGYGRLVTDDLIALTSISVRDRRGNYNRYISSTYFLTTTMQAEHSTSTSAKISDGRNVTQRRWRLQLAAT